METYYTFRHHDALRGKALNPAGHTSTRRTLNFNGKSICLSDMLSRQMGLKSGAHVAFTYDETKPERIFIRTADYPDDDKEIQSALSIKNKKRLQCTNTAVVRHVLQYAGATTSCTCLVAGTPTKIDGKDHYQIMVDCPVMIN